MSELLSRKSGGGNPKTSGRFETREQLETFVVNYGLKCIPIKIIVAAAGCSRKVVDTILKAFNINGYFKKLVEMARAKA